MERGARPAVRDAELYRRPAFLVGDEPAVLRYRRRFHTKRRAVQGGFVAGVVGVGLALRAAGADGLLPAAVGFAAVSSAFVVGHLAVGKRKWMTPVEAFEDGVAACEITALFCRRRFVPWKDVEAIDMREGEGGLKTLVVRTASGRSLESAPGEFDDAGKAAMEARRAAAKAEAAAQKALFESLASEGSAHS